jgi:hypothetical protein
VSGVCIAAVDVRGWLNELEATKREVTAQTVGYDLEFCGT